MNSYRLIWRKMTLKDFCRGSLRHDIIPNKFIKSTRKKLEQCMGFSRSEQGVSQLFL